MRGGGLNEMFVDVPDYILVLAQDGNVASPAFGPCSGCVGSLALVFQYPVKQAGHSLLSVLLLLVELAELGHSTEQVPYTPSLLIGQLYHPVKLINKYILFTVCMQMTVCIHYNLPLFSKRLSF